MIRVLIFKAGNNLGESASNAALSLRQRSWLDRTATSVWQRERAFVNLLIHRNRVSRDDFAIALIE